MKRALARWLVRIAAAVIDDSRQRERYAEQWVADVDGADELGMSPLAVGFGACLSAPALRAQARLAVQMSQPRQQRRNMPPIGVLGTAMHLVHGGRRPSWARLAAIVMVLALLAGIGLLLV